MFLGKKNRTIIKKKLSPNQRDFVNAFIQEFPFPRGIPKIHFGSIYFLS